MRIPEFLKHLRRYIKWQRVLLWRALLPSNVRHLTADDRRLLEERVFRSLCIREPHARILFVGCATYTRWYPYIFLFYPRMTFHTVDPDPTVAAYGSPSGHWVKSFMDLSDSDLPEARYSVLFMNGVFGYGIDRPEQKTQALQQAYNLLTDNGLLVIGYKNPPQNPDIEPALVKKLPFESVKVPGFNAYSVLSTNSSHATFIAFRKKSGSASL